MILNYRVLTFTLTFAFLGVIVLYVLLGSFFGLLINLACNEIHSRNKGHRTL